MASVLSLSMAISRVGRCFSRASASRVSGSQRAGIEGDQHGGDVQLGDVEERLVVLLGRPRPRDQRRRRSRCTTIVCRSETGDSCPGGDGPAPRLSVGARRRPPGTSSPVGTATIPSSRPPCRQILEQLSLRPPRRSRGRPFRAAPTLCAAGLSLAARAQPCDARCLLADVVQTARFFSLRRSRSLRPAPDAEPLVVGQRVLQALAPHVAGQADLLGLPGRARPSRGRTPPDRSARTAHAPASSVHPRRRLPSIRTSVVPPRPLQSHTCTRLSRLRGTWANNIDEITCLS